MMETADITSRSSPVRLVGRELGGYRLTRLLGDGGMGAVYLGEMAAIKCQVAIKVMHPHYITSEEMERRFLNEARAANAVDHPGLVKVTFWGKDPAAGLFLVMEYLKGLTLSDILQSQGLLAVERAARLLQQVASAMAAAHALGIFHRDLKPKNIMVVADPQVTGGERTKVLDFGVAKLQSMGDPDHQSTRTGLVMGTPAYMSPEQCSKPRTVDHRTDIFALGVIAYELLTGQLPFVVESPGDMVLQSMRGSPAPLRQRCPTAPPALERLVERALAAEPADRPQTMEAFAMALQAAVEGGDMMRAYEQPTSLGEDGVQDPMPVERREAAQDLALAPTGLGIELDTGLTPTPPVQLGEEPERSMQPSSPPQPGVTGPSREMDGPIPADAGGDGPTQPRRSAASSLIQGESIVRSRSPRAGNEGRSSRLVRSWLGGLALLATGGAVVGWLALQPGSRAPASFPGNGSRAGSPAGSRGQEARARPAAPAPPRVGQALAGAPPVRADAGPAGVVGSRADAAAAPGMARPTAATLAGPERLGVRPRRHPAAGKRSSAAQERARRKAAGLPASAAGKTGEKEAGDPELRFRELEDEL